MSTLTIGTLVWFTFTHEGSTAFACGQHAIVKRDGESHLLHKGRVIRSNPSTSELLQEASPVILDYYADQIIPSWMV